MPARQNEWLIVVDMQRAFADPPSPWASADFYRALPQVERLVEAYRGRVILTRYVAPMPPTGAWVSYFEAWPSLLLPEQHPAWELKLPPGEGVFVETRATFGKWDAAMAARVGQDAALAICGVATECCVLATVLGAIDAGRFVRLATDACAGGTPEAHGQTLGILAGAAPLVELVQTAALV
ncbi:MAG TPA: cysteine hydrolase [Acidisoma sp.]|jgi:nicotinamidase-related amidase|uniref:cysteine hydrolase family protein n=1 Tax=Acidisoma sp. TaxID=1872115 RepID=UPI002CC967CA|nr:cysteine hydrolase [Acidisoma sp.]HTI01689.1 cysteine hydrolase [Acidisoma sp.]